MEKQLLSNYFSFWMHFWMKEKKKNQDQKLNFQCHIYLSTQPSPCCPFSSIFLRVVFTSCRSAFCFRRGKLTWLFFSSSSQPASLFMWQHVSRQQQATGHFLSGGKMGWWRHSCGRRWTAVHPAWRQQAADGLEAAWRESPAPPHIQAHMAPFIPVYWLWIFFFQPLLERFQCNPTFWVDAISCFHILFSFFLISCLLQSWQEAVVGEGQASRLYRIWRNARESTRLAELEVNLVYLHNNSS